MSAVCMLPLAAHEFAPATGPAFRKAFLKYGSC